MTGTAATPAKIRWTNPRLAGHIRELDGIRGIAIALVLWHHLFGQRLAAGSGNGLAYIRKSLTLSWSGVDLFFVLSGFLIGGILLDAKGSAHCFRTFYARRVARIFPLYYCCVALLLAIAALHGFSYAPPLNIPIWSYFTFTQNFQMGLIPAWGPDWIGATWSLAVEEQFYLLLPLIVWSVSTRAAVIIMTGFVLLSPVLRAVLFHHGFAFTAIYTWLPCRMDTLAIGVLLAIAARNERIWKSVVRHRARFVAVLAILALAFASLTWAPTRGRVNVIAGYSVVALFYGCVVAAAVGFASSWIGPVLRLGPLRRLGTIAYGTYLIHQPVNWMAHGLILHSVPRVHGAASLMVTLFGLAVTIGIALTSWHLLERPIIDRVRRRFSY